MKKLVVDTNIVFSTILNTESNIGDLLMNSDEVFTFYSDQYLRQEIDNHKEKLIEKSKYHIFCKIHFKYVRNNMGDGRG